MRLAAFDSPIQLATNSVVSVASRGYHLLLLNLSRRLVRRDLIIQIRLHEA